MLALVIVCILMVVMMQGMGGIGLAGPTVDRKDGMGKTIPGAARASAQDDVCRSNLSQIREAMAAAKMSSPDGNVSSLDDLSLPQSVLECPIGHERYQYDASTGQVHCPHPGHENF